MAEVGGCTSCGPRPFESSAASLRSQAAIADRSAAISRDEQGVGRSTTAVVRPPDLPGAVTADRGNRLNIAV